MLQISRWSIALIAAVLAAAVWFLLPNFFSEETVEGWPDWMPKQQIVLGLDLQGGSSLLYQLNTDEFVNDQLATLAGEVRGVLRQDPSVDYSVLSTREQIANTQYVQVRIDNPAELDEARDRLETLQNPLSNALLGGGATLEFDLEELDGGLFRFTYNDAGLVERTRTLVQQSIEVISSRVNELGTTEPSIQRQGDDRILVEVPGLDDPQRLKDLIGQTAEMTFHLLSGTTGLMTIEEAEANRGIDELVFAAAENQDFGYIVGPAMVRGQDLVDAQTRLDQQNGEWVVSFRLNTAGARAFGDVTQSNVGRPFAIVLDNVVISAPVINEPILGGEGQISGNFTVEEANDLAILLRAGALPVELTIIEERTVGPGLGEDSVRAGQIAAIVGTVAVVAFMLLVYGFLGALANVAVILNIGMIFAVMTLLGATLTLPGIAGIVLIVGTAVDSNVLIYERIREEFRGGRSAIQAIDLGFQRALNTILDANITTLIAALVLFYFGSGPIRGFAVTLGIGIITTLFTAFLVTRLMIATWVRRRRPAAITL
jgi:preprotein translocase subunit SecD/SecD/SecF fusion protein